MPEPLIVIGLCGKARSGKDTVAKILDIHAGFQRLAFADGVRSMLTDLDGPTWEYRKERDAHDMTERKAMQLGGTECRLDALCPDHWIHHVAIKIRYASHYHPVPKRRFVVSDMRYPYEADTLGAIVREWGGIWDCWRIHRPDAPGIAESSHSSEQFIDVIPAHRTIDNDGTIEELSRVSIGLLREFYPQKERRGRGLDGQEWVNTAWGRIPIGGGPIAVDAAHAATDAA